MQIDDVRRLRGPNVHLPHPVAVIFLDLQELTGRETTDVPGFTTRLLELCPFRGLQSDCGVRHAVAGA